MLGRKLPVPCYLHISAVLFQKVENGHFLNTTFCCFVTLESSFLPSPSLSLPFLLLPFPSLYFLFLLFFSFSYFPSFSSSPSSFSQSSLLLLNCQPP